MSALTAGEWLCGSCRGLNLSSSRALTRSSPSSAICNHSSIQRSHPVLHSHVGNSSPYPQTLLPTYTPGTHLDQFARSCATVDRLGHLRTERLACLGQRDTSCLESRELRGGCICLLVLCLPRREDAAQSNGRDRHRNEFLGGAILVGEPDVRLDVLDRLDAPPRHLVPRLVEKHNSWSLQKFKWWSHEL